MGIEPMTSFLPRKRSATELLRHKMRAALYSEALAKKWVERDSNPRSPKAPDLQSGAIDRSAIHPCGNPNQSRHISLRPTNTAL